MKRLLLTTSAFFATCLALFGANPSYEAFLGTNGIIITSNPPQGRIIIDGRALTNGLSIGGVSGITNLFSQTLSNSSIKPLVVGVGNAAGATNTTGEIRGIEAGANITLTPNGSNYVIASTGGGGSSGISNLFTPSLSNATIKPIVFGGVGNAAGMTNSTGQIYGLEAGGNVTITPNGSNLVVAATVSGSGISTNANQFGPSVELTIKDTALLTNALNRGAGFLGAVTNILTAPQFLGTNVVFDGSLSSWFQFNPATGPETNYVFTNIQAGQTISVKTFVTNGTSVRLKADLVDIPAAWYLGNNGTAANLNSNAPSVVYVSRDSLVPATNVTIWTRDFETAPGANITFTTNFPAGTVTIASTGGGGGTSDAVWTNANAEVRLAPGTGASNLVFRSDMTDLGNVTNAIFTITNSVPLSHTNLAMSYWNAGTNFMTMDAIGRILLGSYQAVNDIWDFGAFRVTDRGEPSPVQIDIVHADSWPTFANVTEWFAQGQNTSGIMSLNQVSVDQSSNQDWRFRVNTNWANSDFKYTADSVTRMRFSPGINDGDANPVYFFDTRSIITAAELFSVRNNGTNMMTVDNFGNLKLRNDLYASNLVTAGTLKLIGGTAGSSVMRTDSNTNLAAVTIGTGLTFDGTTLAATGSGGGPGFADLNWTNNTDVLYPTVQSNRIHFSTAATNGARINFEYYQPRRSLRHGVVTGTQWDTTNLGIVSVAFGSNSANGGFYASILGGSRNLIPTNSEHSVIAGGENNSVSSGGHSFIGAGNGNTIGSLSSNSFIGGGSVNVIDSGVNDTGAAIVGGSGNRARAIGSFIGGGAGNDARATYSVIAGGLNNVAGDDVGTTDVGSTIGGGEGNTTFGAYSTIAGGNKNLVNADTGTNATIGGGIGNTTSSINTTIAGGALNVIENLAEQATIGGGYTNYISTAQSAAFSTIPGGVSNRINSAEMAWVLGSFGTNSTPKSILLSPAGTHGSNRLHVTATATTNIGPFYIQGSSGSIVGRSPVTLSVNATAVLSAGAAETNLITYSVPGNALTNTGDRLVIRASGRFAANANPKQLKLIYGSETILDTTSQIANSGAWTIEAEIIRTANSAQSASAEYHGTAESLLTTASAVTLAQNNGIANVLKITSTAAGDGDVTNRTLTVEWWPSP